MNDSKLPKGFKKNLIEWCGRHEICEHQAKSMFQNCRTKEQYTTALLQLDRNLTKKEITTLISKLLVGMELSKDQ